LPRKSIARAQILGEILVDEHVATACLGARHQSALRALSQFFRMHEQELGCLRDVHGSHAAAASQKLRRLRPVRGDLSSEPNLEVTTRE
jgi:hypothetical protein